MRRFAIFLSCERYANYTNTDYCHSDSDSLKSVLTEKCDYPKENILQIKLNPEENQEATQILSEIDSLLQRSEIGDTILFFYAGHGLAVNGESYLILPGTKVFDVTTSSLALRDIHYYLSANQRLNVRIFDCCHSGENIREATPSLDSNEFIRTILSEGGEGIITFSSCALNEKSYVDEDIKQGAFTAALVNAIASIPENNPVFIESLKLDVCNRVQKWSEERNKKQTPTLTVHINGNMPIGFMKTADRQISSTEAVVEVSFEDRLNRFRSMEVVTEKFYPVLLQSIGILSTEVERQGVNFNYYGMGIDIKPPSGCESIPNELERRIVLNMKDERTMHTMEVVRNKRPNMNSLFGLSSIFNSPPEYDVFYNLTQSSEMPECFVEAKLKSDGIAPHLAYFFISAHYK
jgi:hypothetical protein